MSVELDRLRRDALPQVQDSPRRVLPIVTRWLGRVSFADALALQQKIVAQKRSDPPLADTILLLEHDPVYTIGRTPDQTSLRGGSHLPHPFFQINRGGQATYHGPGQLIGYPIIDLRNGGQDLHKYLRWIEALLIEFLAGFEIEAQQRAGLTGVWVEERKIKRVRRFVAVRPDHAVRNFERCHDFNRKRDWKWRDRVRGRCDDGKIGGTANR